MPPLKRRDFIHLLTLAGGAAATKGLAADRSGAPAAVSPPADRGDTLLHPARAWERLGAEVAAAPASLPALAGEAALWRTGTLPSVVRKKHPSPSGDPRDYYSIAPYAWPDSKRPDGKPWITRDGQTNPEFYQYDSQALETLCTAVQRLAAHAFLATDAADAQRAGRFLRTWFVDPATRMNPHLSYAQAIPGRHTGSATGIIDTTSLIFLFDAVTRLPLNEQWTAADLAATRAWAAQYVEWLLGSAAGKKEGSALNNHGTWYDAQVACFALFAGNPEIARAQIEKTARERIAKQIEPDGRQPHELRRTLALTYTTYNLLALACLARAGEHVGIDLWHWTSDDGRSLRGALNWVLPFYRGEQTWSHPQIRPFDATSAAPLLFLAWQGTGDASLLTASQKVETHAWQRVIFSKSGMSGRKAPGSV